MRKIRLNETNFKNMLTEMVKEVLLLEADTKVIRARNGCAPYLEKFGDIKEVFKKFREDFYGEGLMGNDKLKTLILAPMFCKFAVENGWTPTSGVITEVKKILFEIVIHHDKDIPELVNEFNNNPNEITWSFIRDKYQPFIDKRQEEENARISQNQYTKDDRYNYKIYGPLTFKQAKEFGDYSYPNGEICYTQKKSTWNSSSYTANNTRKVYVLVLSNWQNIPCEHTSDGYITHTTDGDPIPENDNGYDLYGMSMIFLIVDKSGDLVVSNTRWNHGCSGREEDIDRMFTKEDIYKLIGNKADKIFKSPYQSIQFDDLIDIGNGYIKVRIGKKWTILDYNNQILYKPNNPEQWFDWVDEFDDNGIARVKLNDKWTCFSLEKQDYLFPNKWFDNVGYFNYNGIATVKLNGKYNWFDKNKGELVWDKPIEQWFDMFEDSYDGNTKVKLNGKYNWFDKNKGELVWDKPIEQWFDMVYPFYNGIAPVNLNGKMTYFSLEKQDYLFQNKWFDMVYPFYNGIAEVKLNGKNYYFTLDGQLLDCDTMQPLSQEQVQKIFQQQQQIEEMVNRLIRNYLR